MSTSAPSDHPVFQAFWSERLAYVFAKVMSVFFVAAAMADHLDNVRLAIWVIADMAIVLAYLAVLQSERLMANLSSDGIPFAVHTVIGVSGFSLGALYWLDIDQLADDRFFFLLTTISMGHLVVAMANGALGRLALVFSGSHLIILAAAGLMAGRPVLSFGAFLVGLFSTRAGTTMSAQFMAIEHERLHTQQQIASAVQEANFDPLTRVYNRRGIEDWYSNNAAAVCGCFFVDLDHFKPINDRFGHELGDTVLTVVAHRLREHIGSDGVISRLGGDEFVIMATNPTMATQDFGEMLLAAIGEPLVLGGDRMRISASMGLATVFSPLSFGDLLRRADNAMYGAKNAGRSQVAVA